MARQRTKAELLAVMKVHQALKTDNQMGDDLQHKAIYWRMAVIWGLCLWQEENFSAGELTKVYQYVNSHNVTDLGEPKREEIRKMLSDKKVEWLLKDRSSMSKKGLQNSMDRAIDEMNIHNTRVCVDYSLLVCEYLIKNERFGRKRLNRDLADIYYLDDKMSAKDLENARKEIYDKKGIWLEFHDDKPKVAFTMVV